MAGGYYWCLGQNPGTGSVFVRACTFNLFPKEKPQGMDQKLWESRKKVKITRERLFKWMNGIWEGRRTMSGYYRRKTPCDEPKEYPCQPGNCTAQSPCVGCHVCQRSEETTQSNITYLFTEQGPYDFNDEWSGQERENKCPKLRDPYFPPGYPGAPGTYEEGKCNNFNNQPSSYGRRPDSDLIKTSYNVCFENHSTAWHETTYQRRNIGPHSTYCDEPAPGICDDGPNCFSIQWNDNTTDRTLQASTCTSSCCPTPTPPGGTPCNCPGPGAQSPLCPVKPIRCYYGNCRVRFFSVASIHIPKTGHWYDPETGDVYPNIVFSSGYPNVDWERTGYTQGDKEGGYQKHSTKVTITVDGVTIPSGSNWGRPYYMGNLTLTDTWTLKEREK